MIFIFRIQGFKNKQKPCSLHTLGVSSEWRDRKRVQLPHAALFCSESLVPYQQDGGKQATWTGWWRKNKVKRVIMWWGRSRHWAMDSPCTLCGWRDGQLRLWAAVSVGPDSCCPWDQGTLEPQTAGWDPGTLHLFLCLVCLWGRWVLLSVEPTCLSSLWKQPNSGRILPWGDWCKIHWSCPSFMITYNYKFQPYKVRKHFIVEVFWTFFFQI